MQSFFSKVSCLEKVTTNGEKRYKEREPLEKRRKESMMIKAKYPDRIPCICERADDRSLKVDKIKFLVPSDITLSQFMMIVRKRLKLQPEKALFFLINDIIIATASTTFHELYKQYADEDGFLYISYSEEAVFGALSK